MKGLRPPSRVEILQSAELAAEAAASRFVSVAASAIQTHGAFVVALSGGHTPQRLYQLLATPRFAPQVDWSRVQVCWGDERCVPPDAPESNYRMAWESLLSRVSIPKANVHRMRGENDPAEEARCYEQQMEQLLDDFGPRLDLVLLGLGADGHTASLFPGDIAVHDSARWVEAVHHEVDGMWRITLTPRLINTAATVVFLVSGGAKADIVASVLAGPVTPHMVPAQQIVPADSEVVWILDRAAAAALQ